MNVVVIVISNILFSVFLYIIIYVCFGSWSVNSSSL